MIEPNWDMTGAELLEAWKNIGLPCDRVPASSWEEWNGWQCFLETVEWYSQVIPVKVVDGLVASMVERLVEAFEEYSTCSVRYPSPFWIEFTDNDEQHVLRENLTLMQVAELAESQEVYDVERALEAGLNLATAELFTATLKAMVEYATIWHSENRAA